MTLQNVCLRLVFAVALAAAVSAAACRRSAATADGPDGGAGSPGTSPYDVEMTDVARVLGGVPPARPKVFAALLELPAWRQYEAESRNHWSAAWPARYEPVRKWANTALKDASANCQTLLHPFGSTDFLPAYLMFPACEGYVLVGPDPVGQVPKLDAATAAQMAAVADDVRRAFPEVFADGDAPGRSPADPRRVGAVTLLLVQLARLDARIVAASRFDIGADGHPLESIPISGGGARPDALSIAFEVPNGRPQSLVYLPADLGDAALKRRPAVWTFLRLQAPFVTLLAPASGIEGDHSTVLRELILAQSRVILADRPALQPQALSPADWTVSTLEPPPGGGFARGAAPTLAVRHKRGAAPTRR